MPVDDIVDCEESCTECGACEAICKSTGDAELCSSCEDICRECDECTTAGGAHRIIY